MAEWPFYRALTLGVGDHACGAKDERPASSPRLPQNRARRKDAWCGVDEEETIIQNANNVCFRDGFDVSPYVLVI